MSLGGWVQREGAVEARARWVPRDLESPRRPSRSAGFPRGREGPRLRGGARRRHRRRALDAQVPARDLGPPRPRRRDPGHPRAREAVHPDLRVRPRLGSPALEARDPRRPRFRSRPHPPFPGVDPLLRRGGAAECLHRSFGMEAREDHTGCAGCSSHPHWRRGVGHYSRE